MRKARRSTVAGVHAPRPRPTVWAALLTASALSLAFLAALGLWRLASLALH